LEEIRRETDCEMKLKKGGKKLIWEIPEELEQVWEGIC
jgi:hypothetical protein